MMSLAVSVVWLGLEAGLVLPRGMVGGAWSVTLLPLVLCRLLQPEVGDGAETQAREPSAAQAAAPGSFPHAATSDASQAPDGEGLFLSIRGWVKMGCMQLNLN